MGDGRDWTFVLDQTCSECGQDIQDLPESELATHVRDVGRRWHAVLTERAADPAMRVRPAPTTWSPTEYGEHVRDVLALYALRTQRMLSEDDPEFADWDPDVTATEKPYGETAPAVVGQEIAANAERLAVVYDWVEPEGWARVGRRSDGARFTVGSLGRYMVHDLRHHLWDVDPALVS